MPRQSIIKRQNRGKRRTRFGIVLDLLLPRHQALLTDNELLKEHSGDDDYLSIIFKMEDKLKDNQNQKKLYVDPHTNEIVDVIQMNRNLKLVKWNCAYCRVEIESSLTNFEPENFTCSKCFEKYLKDNKWIPDVILQDSLAFTKHCKKLLREDQKNFINYLKRSKS